MVKYCVLTNNRYIFNYQIFYMMGLQNIKITPSGLKESHVHGVIITKEAPNYRLE